MKTITKTKPARRARAPGRKGRLIRCAPEWGWHFRTLLALRTHLLGGIGDRLRGAGDAMESPSLHAADLADELYDRELAQVLPPDPGAAIREVEDAIYRLETGAYGVCDATGRRMTKAQLREMPWCGYAPKA